MRWPKILGRFVAAALALGAASGLSAVMTANPAAAAGTGRVLASPCLNLRTGPSAGYALIGCVPVNTTISIDCTVSGSNVSGPYGATTLWDHASFGGIQGFVSDAWVYTGTAAAVAGTCGQSAPVPTPTKADRAVAWANSMVGSQSYAGQCERFVENAYGTQSRYLSAMSAFTALRNAGLVNFNSTGIPRGALVFSKSPIDGGYGHVELSRGDGSFVSGGMGNPTVKVVNTPVPGSGGTFLGWAYAPASWPGR